VLEVLPARDPIVGAALLLAVDFGEVAVEVVGVDLIYGGSKC
jgi:hypothetical protein